MALFRSNDPVAQAEAERGKLVQLATDAENTFTAATDKSNTLALDGADDTVMKIAALAVPATSSAISIRF
ncbi:hypothetical protein [Bradyrhizobium erythrophlei]|uniref:Uncharacterized protein n=1 Tax=Bradyrhizobium erythrophlei TaxID=1437360 RepID=A0A1M5MU96_9BRAD|nr:hypothetical protein [Bradyrhizobium erythrophlei]SHG80924.1 hypothetical protein SAMN05443248_2730 [Bradyrhizobium erythrophlei]